MTQSIDGDIINPGTRKSHTGSDVGQGKRISKHLQESE